MTRGTFLLFLSLPMFTSFRCIYSEQMDAESCQSAHRSVVMLFMTETDKVNELENGGEGEEGWGCGCRLERTMEMLGK